MRGFDRINAFLPDELIMEIFRRLESKPNRDACSLVCKRWLSLERLGRDTLRIGACASPDNLVKMLGLRFPNVRSVSFDEWISVSMHVQRRRSSHHSLSKGRRGRGFDESLSGEDGMGTSCLSDSGLTAVGESFINLEKLSLIWCSSITDVGLKYFSANCRSLKSLNLQGCYIGDEGLAAVGRYCNFLQDLNLRFCEGLTDIGLVQLAVGCGRTLKSLGVAACAKITDVSVEAVASHCESLESLSLLCEIIHNKGLISVAKKCSMLKVLKLQCLNITDEALQAVGFCASLEVLALYSFKKFTDRSLYAIGTGCKGLKYLTLTDCYSPSNRSLDFIAFSCSELMHFELNGCKNIGTGVLKSVGKFCGRLSEFSMLYETIESDALSEIGRGCKFLQTLKLVNCSGVGDDSICSIARGCKYLKKLHIRECDEVGNKGIVAVGQNCKFLTDLSLLFCNRIGNEAPISIGQGCSLHHLNVSGCRRISDAGIRAIATGSPQLSSLDVSVLQKLGDNAMVKLGEGCPLLKDLVISHCPRITDTGLIAISRKCTLLESCDVVSCPGITDAGVATMVATCTRIQKVVVEKSKVGSRTERRAGRILNYPCDDL